MEKLGTQLKKYVNIPDDERPVVFLNFIGGGTPSAVSVVLYKKLFTFFLQHVKIFSEITIEANPNSSDKEWLRGMRDLGVNRFSFGVQSFNNNKLKYLGRNHNDRDAINAIENSYKIVLAGGTQMACVLLIVNSILKQMQVEINSANIALWTTNWVYEDKNSDIESLLNMTDFPINSFCSDFNFNLATHPALKLYDQGEAKEGVGAGGALCYGLLNGLNQEEIVKEIEKFLVLYFYI